MAATSFVCSCIVGIDPFRTSLEAGMIGFDPVATGGSGSGWSVDQGGACTMVARRRPQPVCSQISDDETLSLFLLENVGAEQTPNCA